MSEGHDDTAHSNTLDPQQTAIMAEGSKEEIVRKANAKATKGGRYVYEAVLGKGGFGVVLKARDEHAPQGNDVVAIKIIEAKKTLKDYILFRRPASVKQGEKEAGLLTELEHDNIVAIRDYFECRRRSTTTSFRLAIVMDFCPGGDLKEYITNAGRRFNIEERLSWYLQLASALKFLHSKSIAHRDLKPENILVDGAGNLKVADVGLAKAIHGSSQQGTSYEQYMQTVAGTLPYMAPEVLDGHSTMNCDVFSMGLVMFVICERPARLIPFAHFLAIQDCWLGELMHSSLLARSMDPLSLLNAVHCSLDEVKLFNQMLQYDYHKRPTAYVVFRRLDEWKKRREEEERRRRVEERRRREKEERSRRGWEQWRRQREEEERRQREQQSWGAWFRSWLPW